MCFTSIKHDEDGDLQAHQVNVMLPLYLDVEAQESIQDKFVNGLEKISRHTDLCQAAECEI